LRKGKRPMRESVVLGGVRYVVLKAKPARGNRKEKMTLDLIRSRKDGRGLRGKVNVAEKKGKYQVQPIEQEGCVNGAH